MGSSAFHRQNLLKQISYKYAVWGYFGLCNFALREMIQELFREYFAYKITQLSINLESLASHLLCVFQKARRY